MINRIQNIFLKLHAKLFGSSYQTSSEAVIWAYRLFLDREPESPLVVTDKLKRLESTQDIRQEFVGSDEFKQKNAGFRSLSLYGNEPPMFIESVSYSELQELFFHIQSEWESLGETEPYFSVLTAEKFISSNIQNTRNEFYNSGLDDVTTLLKTLERNGIDHTSFKTCLEFGCGLGRVTGWLAKKFDIVEGYDISKSHLRLAKQYLDEKGIQNASLHHISNPQEIGCFPKVDVVYSMIVLQHNPPPIIRLIIKELLRALNPGGIAFFQVPTYRLDYKFSLKEYLGDEHQKGGIEMHVFPQNEIFDLVDSEQCKLVEILEDSATGLRKGERSNTFLIQNR